MSAWDEWRRYVKAILAQGRPMNEAERAHADELVKKAKAEERREWRKQKRIASGGVWHE